MNMKKQALLVLTAVALGVVFLFAVVYATQAPDSITMESKVFAKHKKALVTFTHKKHNVDYKIACAECHHAYKEGKNVWKEGDAVQKCCECHTEAKAPKGDKSSKKEQIEKYYYSAIHANCVGCHKDTMKADPKKAAPTKCAECHPKAK
jgi:hypothetical protein